MGAPFLIKLTQMAQHKMTFGATHWLLAMLSFRSDWFGKRGSVCCRAIQEKDMRKAGVLCRDLRQAIRIHADHTGRSYCTD